VHKLHCMRLQLWLGGVVRRGGLEVDARSAAATPDPLLRRRCHLGSGAARPHPPAALWRKPLPHAPPRAACPPSSPAAASAQRDAGQAPTPTPTPNLHTRAPPLLLHPSKWWRRWSLRQQARRRRLAAARLLPKTYTASTRARRKQKRGGARSRGTQRRRVQGTPLGPSRRRGGAAGRRTRHPTKMALGDPGGAEALRLRDVGAAKPWAASGISVRGTWHAGSSWVLPGFPLHGV
jgi:hypothetical protein